MKVLDSTGTTNRKILKVREKADWSENLEPKE